LEIDYFIFEKCKCPKEHSMSNQTIVIRQEDVPVRKKQPPPGKPMRDPKAYRRRPKHRNREDGTQRHEKAPDGFNPPGASLLRHVSWFRPR
jgi:hypothetical protein